MLNFFKNNNIESVDVAYVSKALDDVKNVLIDVRETNEYNNGHAKGAKSYPLSTIDNNTALLLSKYDKVFVICQSGARSSRACTMLKGMGIGAINVIGGTTAWRNAGLTIEK